jgi:hypothetical protein
MTPPLLTRLQGQDITISRENPIIGFILKHALH